MNLLYNIGLEEDFLGAIVFDNDLVDLTKIESKHFYNTSTQELFKAMLKLKKENHNIDPVNLKYELKEGNKYKALSKLVELSENGLTKRDFFLSNQKEIIRLYEKRITKQLLTKGLDDLPNVKDANEILTRFQKASEENIKTDIEIKGIFNIGEKTISNIEDDYNKGIHYSGMETGYTKLDKKLSGINKKEFTVIGARPSIGKTAFALELALRLSVKNKVLFFSLEMSDEQLYTRLLSNISKIPLTYLKNRKFKPERFSTLIKSVDDISKRNLKIVDAKDITVEDIKSTCIKEKNQNSLDVVIIDYLTLCSTREKKPNLREEVNRISKKLRILSDLDVAVISLAQLNRAVEGRTTKIPMLSDLKETGNIEQDANTVLFLSEPEDNDAQYFSEEDIKLGAEILNLTIAKNRDGQKNILIKYKYCKKIQTIEEI